MIKSKRWILTGASGWFGRTALYEYEQLHGPEALRRDVIAYSSKDRLVDIDSPHGPIQSLPLDELDAESNADGLIHLAFLTRDRLAAVGLQRYIQANRAITARVASFIERNPKIPIITTSSGAAAVFESGSLDLEDNPYAALKREEEDLWQKNSAERMATVFRVYAASGRFIKDPKMFALSDFLTRAIRGEQIEIRSKRPVIRSYVHVGTMMRLFWAMLAKPLYNSGIQDVDAVLETLTLVDLAQVISEHWHLPSPIYSIDDPFTTDNYQSDSCKFRSLLKNYNINAPSLIEQLTETLIYLKVNSKASA